MTELTPLSEVQRLSRIVDELREAGDKLAEWERKAVRAREAYTVAFNLAYLAAVGPIPERKAQAENATHEERLRAEGSEAEVRIWTWAARTSVCFASKRTSHEATIQPRRTGGFVSGRRR